MTVRVIDGLESHAVELGIQQTPACLRDALDEAHCANQDFQSLSSNRRTLLLQAVQTADDEAKAFLDATKKILRHHLGERWNPSWLEAGFAQNTTQTPKTMPQREALLKTLAAYFTTHPEQENAGLEVTSARALRIHQAIGKAQRELKESDAKLGELHANRNEAMSILRKRLRGVITELNVGLESDSPMWKAFGLNEPALSQRMRKSKKIGMDQAAAAEKGAAIGVATPVSIAA